MERIYAIYDNNQQIMCLFRKEDAAIEHCKHMNKDSKHLELGLPEEFYVNTVTLH